MSAEAAMMQRAIQLARRGWYSTRPNPRVGCVLVQDGKIVGEGWHERAGEAHAEVMALQAAGNAARGATAYVTLEPCSFHGRTPPCAQALIDAGVSRVVVAAEDPHPNVSGQGIAALQQAGVQVDLGLGASAAAGLNTGFTARHTKGRPYIICKLASSVDGRTAMANGESQWITGPAAREDVQRLRAASCAILTGSGTVLQDDPRLTVRDKALLQRLPSPPLRVVLDRRSRLQGDAQVFSSDAPTLLFNSAKAAQLPVAVEQISSSATLAQVIDELTQRECNQLLVECGPTLAGAVFQAGLVDELVVYMAPLLMGSQAKPLLELPIASMSEARPLQLVSMRRIGPDLRLNFKPGEA